MAVNRKGKSDSGGKSHRQTLLSCALQTVFGDCRVQIIPALLGYRFGYRHQFGLITVNYAKLLNVRHL
jgi:hypothetical protein